MNANGGLFGPLSAVLALAAAACSSGSATPGDAGTSQSDVVLADSGLVPVPQTTKCAGAATTCLSGTVAVSGFTGQPVGLQANLFRVYPYGSVTAEQTQPVALDGTYAFSNLASWAHYYVQAEAVFADAEGDAGQNIVTTTVGPAAVPSTGTLALTVKPVSLEVFQEAPSGGATTVSWAQAHIYDPKDGAPRSDASATFTVSGNSYPMPYTTNPAGTMSYFVELPANVAGSTAFSVTTTDSAAGLSAHVWHLVGAPASFTGAITAPASTTVAKVGSPLPVAWQAVPAASFSIVELFFGTSASAVYVSPSADAPDDTMETIPGSAIAMPGTYLLNVAFSDATCPASADGCVYNDVAVPVSFTAQ